MYVTSLSVEPQSHVHWIQYQLPELLPYLTAMCSTSLEQGIVYPRVNAVPSLLHVLKNPISIQQMWKTTGQSPTLHSCPKLLSGWYAVGLSHTLINTASFPLCSQRIESSILLKPAFSNLSVTLSYLLIEARLHYLASSTSQQLSTLWIIKFYLTDYTWPTMVCVVRHLNQCFIQTVFCPPPPDLGVLD